MDLIQAGPVAASETPQSDHAPSTCGSALRSDLMFPQRSGEEERDEWLSADYRRRRDPLCTPVQSQRLRHAPELALPAYARYGALQDEVPEDDMEWDIKGPHGGPLEDFRISPSRGSVRWSRWQREEEEYMEGVRRGVPG